MAAAGRRARRVNGGGQRAAHSPVDGWRASLGFTAEHHLPVLHRLHGIHDAAGLLGEDGALQDAALCGTQVKDNRTFRKKKKKKGKEPISRWQKQDDGALSVWKGETTSAQNNIHSNRLSEKSDLQQDASSAAV